MLNKIIRFSIANKSVIGMLTLLLVIWGIWSASRLPVDAVPDITNNQVQIITSGLTLSAQEVENLVTYPVEQRMATLPELEEVRSISRFGLSVITVVFKEKVDIYFVRQLVNEKLLEAQQDIPKDIPRPYMAPVSTGLGQVYEYVLHPKQGSEHKYTAADLRTMQDWIVARQLYGIEGLAEVNSFGGVVKQYEVSLNPDRMKSLKVTIPEIFDALEKNNQNTGGAYVEKNPYAYFIRGIGAVTSLGDIEKIVVKHTGAVPLLIRDVAKVQYGSALRYGALTRDGEGEVVGGIVMMLKGANSAEVVARVKERMKQIEKTLPDDIVVDPYLDRTHLVQRAIATVEKNLIEGALIVIFVLVIFLGNARAGLIVASAIPLSLLFALGMMNLFGVSANLMSLGAIDFGLIIDGAVIIVEATMHHLGLRKSKHRLSQKEMDEEVFSAASRIRKSAAFGEIIILIVYIPILTLQGIEGKMFKPMAQTVSFAILGALILSTTYIPMMSALFLSKKPISEKQTLADKIMSFFQRTYAPLLNGAIKIKHWVIAAAAAALVIALVVFSRMGGEFIPKLEEGDFAFHCILPQGTSLTQSVNTAQQASRILKGFPEVKEVIAKTGSAEVPTDPMPPEGTDLMIILKDRKEWKHSKSYDELADEMMEKLSAMPGVFFEASQPIQMRFNELMTGVRQDVAIKIFGEDLDSLVEIAPRIARVVQTVKGATLPQIEKVQGLSQITVHYNRSRMAGYGVNIEDVNQVLRTAFAGETAGVVYENERKFDLVVRLDSSYRTSIDDVANLYIPLANGAQVPLSQLATVSFEEGPSQISREDAKRRIVVGFNVAGRDVQSVVEEIQQKLKTFRLPTGYYLTYGGTFENLKQASNRLMIAVPVAMLLIFVLLYFTFHSLKQAVLIFTAIPMAAIGGVFALLLRGMPFSISAGVGFIALFGVAVLNGIVLIGTFNLLEKNGWNDVTERVKEGTKIRLRAVLMTATVASLGFLPMAVSTGAGAEVQKPLATVVIGGLITATCLTLIVLPLLYIIFTGYQPRRFKAASVVLLMVGIPFLGRAQQPAKSISFSTALTIAYQNNSELKAAGIRLKQAEVRVKTAPHFPKTGVFIENEEFNPNQPDGLWKIGLSQSVPWPGVVTAKRKLLNEQKKTVAFAASLKAAELKKDLQQTYFSLWYLQSKQALWHQLDSIYTSFAHAAKLRVKMGESAGLDSITAMAKSAEVRLQLNETDTEIRKQQHKLQYLLNTDSFYMPPPGMPEKLSVLLRDSADVNAVLLQLQKQNVTIAGAELELEKQYRMPDFEGRLFSQRLYTNKNPYSGFSFTIAVPIFGASSYKNKLTAARMEQDYLQLVYTTEKQRLYSKLNGYYREVETGLKVLSYYETSGLSQAEAIISAASLAYKGGEIDFPGLVQYLAQAVEMQKNYIDMLHQYNLAVIEIDYLTNNHLSSY